MRLGPGVWPSGTASRLTRRTRCDRALETRGGHWAVVVDGGLHHFGFLQRPVRPILPNATIARIAAPVIATKAFPIRQPWSQRPYLRYDQ